MTCNLFVTSLNPS